LSRSAREAVTEGSSSTRRIIANQTTKAPRHQENYNAMRLIPSRINGTLKLTKSAS
jgi:hypothetical protein